MYLWSLLGICNDHNGYRAAATAETGSRAAQLMCLGAASPQEMQSRSASEDHDTPRSLVLAAQIHVFAESRGYASCQALLRQWQYSV